MEYILHTITVCTHKTNYHRVLSSEISFVTLWRFRPFDLHNKIREGKAIPLQVRKARRAPRVSGSQISRQSAYEDGKIVSPTQRQSLPPGNNPGTHFCKRMSQPQRQSGTGRIMSMNNSNDAIANRTRDFPACSAVSPSTAPPRQHNT